MHLSSQRDNYFRENISRKAHFTRVTEVVESCQMCWNLFRMQHICNKYATKSMICTGHFQRNLGMSFFHYKILLIASTNSLVSKCVYTFSVSVIAPECPTIFLMTVWFTPASANMEMQVCLQQ